MTRERAIDSAVWKVAVREYIWTARQIGVRDILRFWLNPDNIPSERWDEIMDEFHAVRG